MEYMDIRFPHLGIVLDHVGRYISIGGFPVMFYGIIIAAGFLGCQPYVAEAFGVDLTPRGTVADGAVPYQTSAEKIFTAGDMRRGQSLVVWAIREGREAAGAIDKSLMGYTAVV